MKKTLAICGGATLLALCGFFVILPAGANIQNRPTPVLWIGSGTITNYLQAETSEILLDEKGNRLLPE